MKLLLIELDHFLVALSISHHLFFALVIIVVLITLHLISFISILPFDLLFHTFDAVVLDVDLITVLVLIHSVLIDLVHVLLLDGLSNSGLLLWVKLIKVLKLLLSHLCVCLFLVLTIFILTIALIIVFAIHLVFFVDVLLDLVGCTFHEAQTVLVPLHHVGIVRTSLLHLESLASVLVREVSCGQV